MTDAELALVRQNVEGLYRGKRRSWQGFGGTGNPFETWDDLKGMAGMSFVLDSDAVFTATGWGASRLIELVKRLQALCDGIIGATEQLVSSAQTIQDLDPLIRAYGMLAQQSIDIRRNNRGGTGSVRRAAIQRELSAFAQDNLAPSVTPAQQDGSSRSPSEARSHIREEIPLLLEKMDLVDTAVGKLSEAVPGIAAVVPTRVALTWVQQITKAVGDMQVRMQIQAPSDRATQAMEDLTQLASGLTALDLIDRVSSPVLERGTFPCAADGSGVGAIIQGAVSAPYQLVAGASDTLSLKIDGAPAVVVTLPSADDFMAFTFPNPASSSVGPPPTLFYNVPAAPPVQSVFFIVDGVPGAAPAAFVGGAAMTTTQVVTALTAVGVIPVDGFAVPYLLIDEILVGTPGSGLNTVRIRHNPAASPGVDLGTHILVFGDKGLLNDFGLSSTFDAGATYLHLEEWPAPTRSQVSAALDAGFLGSGVLVQPKFSLVASGSGYVELGSPTSVFFAHYYGIGTWQSDNRKLTLSGDDLGRVQVGDSVVFSSTLLGLVQTIEVDGVVVDVSTGSPLSSGTYSGAVFPAGISAGMTLESVFLNHTSSHRVSGAPTVAVDGRLEIPVSRPTYLYTFAPAKADVRVVHDVESFRSADNGPAGTLELTAVANNAAAALGMSLGLVTSDVDQLATTGDFVTAGVSPGDVVRPSSGPDWIVDEVISPARLRVTGTVDGTFSGPVTIYNHRHLGYNELLVNQLSAWDAAPSQDDITREAAECTRAEGMTAAGNRLKALLLQLKSAASSVETVARGYRAVSGTPSPYMTDLREALEEAGADRAADYLQSARIQEMLGFTADDANTSRQLMRTMRTLGRKALGTSVYVAARELEQAILLRPESEIFVDGTALDVEDIGPPRSTQR